MGLGTTADMANRPHGIHQSQVLAVLRDVVIGDDHLRDDIQEGEMKTEKKPARKKYRHGAVYHRTPSGRYTEIGYDWTGFPMDGIWLVQNGCNNMACLIGSKERVPIFALNYRVHEQELCKRIQDSMKRGGLSLMDEARLACDFFSEIAEKQKVKK